MSQSIHPRVLEVELEHHSEWALACWSDTDPSELRDQLYRLLELTFLAEYSQQPSIALGERNFQAVQLLVFDELSQPSREVLGDLGFAETQYVPDQYEERMAAWRQEAEAEGVTPPESPVAVFKADIERPNASISETLDEIQRKMIDRLDGEVFGETPGGPSKLMATHFRQHFNTTITPDRKGLHSFELFLVQEKARTLRWMPPMIFQGLCDFVGVVLQAEYRLNVQWALSTPDDMGFAPPPVFRVPASGGGHEHIPVGEMIIQWCVLPQPEETPSLAQRIDEIVSS